MSVSVVLDSAVLVSSLVVKNEGTLTRLVKLIVRQRDFPFGLRTTSCLIMIFYFYKTWLWVLGFSAGTLICKDGSCSDHQMVECVYFCMKCKAIENFIIFYISFLKKSK